MELDQKLLQRFIPFQSLSPVHLADLVKGSKLQKIDAGTILFKATDTLKQSFYLVDGAVDLRDTAGKKIAAVSGGTPAAQRALQTQSGQPVTAIVTSPATLLLIDKNLIDLVLTWNQAGEYVVADLAGGDGDDTDDGDWMSALLESPLFTQIPAANIQQLFTKFDSLSVKAGQAVIMQGEAGDYFYVISQGDADVIRNRGAADEKKLAHIGAGSFFGEEALISDAPRNACVVMRTDGIVKRLNKEDFKALLLKPVLNYLDASQLAAAKQNPSYKIVVVDVRLPSEYAGNHLEDSINIPLPELRAKIPTLDERAIYVAVCDSGRRSEIAAHLLSQAGFNAYLYKAS